VSMRHQFTEKLMDVDFEIIVSVFAWYRVSFVCFNMTKMSV